MIWCYTSLSYFTLEKYDMALRIFPYTYLPSVDLHRAYNYIYNFIHHIIMYICPTTFSSTFSLVLLHYHNQFIIFHIWNMKYSLVQSNLKLLFSLSQGMSLSHQGTKWGRYRKWIGPISTTTWRWSTCRRNLYEYKI